MPIMVGAIMPKLMGHVADRHGMSAAFIVPMISFIVVAGYGYFWSKLGGTSGVVAQLSLNESPSIPETGLRFLPRIKRG